jgi:hypothetical protein
MGIGLPVEGIDFAAIAAWAEDCDANGWSMFGVVYEPGDRWANLRDICIAGGGQPLFAGAVLSFDWNRPRVALDTLSEADLASGDHEVTAMQTWRDRVNTIVPRYRSEANHWEPVAAEAVGVSTYVTEDGEERREEFPFNFVKDVDQAAQLARYRLENGRELAPITLRCKPRMRAYRPGECLQLDVPQLGLDTLAVIQKREIDPATMEVTFTLIGETTAKHAFALGETGTPPPTPAIGQTGEERDAVIAAALEPPRAAHEVVGYDPPDWPLTSDDASITIAAFDGTLDNGDVVSFAGDTITGLDPLSKYGVFFDLIALTYSAALQPATAERADSDLAFLGWQSTSDGGGTYPSAPTPVPGAGGGGGYYVP